jgi:putative FmdB family regulatory protein
MPIYEYKCYACGHTFETLQKISDAPLIRCPDCGKDALKKLISVRKIREVRFRCFRQRQAEGYCGR